MAGYPDAPGLTAELAVLLSQLTGLGNAVEAVDISVTDHTATMTNCKAITCTDGTVIKVDFKDATDTTKTVILPAEVRIIAIRNVTKVYKAGTDCTGNIYLHR